MCATSTTTNTAIVGPCTVLLTPPISLPSSPAPCHQTHAPAGFIQITDATHQLIKGEFACTCRGEVAIKSKVGPPLLRTLRRAWLCSSPILLPSLLSPMCLAVLTSSPPPLFPICLPGCDQGNMVTYLLQKAKRRSSVLAEEHGIGGSIGNMVGSGINTAVGRSLVDLGW